jgi:hypothetical protein
MKMPMKKLLLIMLALLFLAAAAGAQPGPAGRDAVRSWLKDLKITEEDLLKMAAVISKDEALIAKARADIRISQANIARILLDASPDLTAVAEEIDASLKAEKSIRLAQIKRQIEVKAIFGEERWKKVLMLIREARVSERKGDLRDSFARKGMDQGEAERWTRLMAILRLCF